MDSENFFSPEIKALVKNSRVHRWLGVGLLVMWACAAAVLADLTDSYTLLSKFFGYSGLLVVTITGIGLTQYMSELSSAAKALDKRLHDAEEHAKIWRQQAESSLDYDEILRLEIMTLEKRATDAEKAAFFWQKEACSSLHYHPTLHP